MTAIFDDPASDLRLAQVCGELPSFAPLYEGADEVGQTAVVFGRGLSRGSRVTLTNAAEEVELRGWRWKSGTSALRWGLNRIEDTVPYETEPGTLLRATFDPDGGPAEAMGAGAIRAAGCSCSVKVVGNWRGWPMASTVRSATRPMGPM
ncbi:MAG: hypothetical protein M5U12_05500 [Verrucomicrobia bacterium]|nr:hypothetical protein [Verrucomicrobiota bacterium]